MITFWGIIGEYSVWGHWKQTTGRTEHFHTLWNRIPHSSYPLRVMIIYTYLSSVLAFYFFSMEVLVVSELSLTDFQMDVMASQATLNYHQGIIQGGLTFKSGNTSESESTWNKAALCLTCTENCLLSWFKGQKKLTLLNLNRKCKLKHFIISQQIS